MVDLRGDFSRGDYILTNFINLDGKEREMVRNWRNSEQIRKWMFTDHVISPDEHLKFMDKLKNETGNFYWVAKREHEGYLGVISLNKLSLKNRNAYLGVYSNPDCKITGAGQILIDMLKGLAFDTAGLHTLKLEVAEINERALGFYKKSGFAEEGRLKEFIFKDGRWYDVIVMGIVNSGV